MEEDPLLKLLLLLVSQVYRLQFRDACGEADKEICIHRYDCFYCTQRTQANTLLSYYTCPSNSLLHPLSLLSLLYSSQCEGPTSSLRLASLLSVPPYTLDLSELLNIPMKVLPWAALVLGVSTCWLLLPSFCRPLRFTSGFTITTYICITLYTYRISVCRICFCKPFRCNT